MQTLIIIALGAVLVLMGIYAFPTPKASYRIIYAAVPAPVVAELEAFRLRHRLKRLATGRSIWLYHDLGAGDEVVLFLHGMGASADIWFQQMAALQDRWRCLAVTYPPFASLDLLASGILALLAQERISRISLVGSSLGGYLAQFLLACNPGLIRRAVLGNTFLPNEYIFRQARLGLRWLPWVPEWAIMAGMRRNAQRLSRAAAEGQLIKAYLYEQTCGAIRKPHLIARCACLCQKFTPPDIRKLGVPTLIIESDNDPLVPMALREELKAAYAGAAVKTFPRAGHFPYLNEPLAYTQVLQEFFQP